MLPNLSILAGDTTTSSDSTPSSGSSEKLTEALKNMVKSPVFYIVIGAIVLLIIAFYLYRRIVKPSSNMVKVVARGGKIYKLIEGSSSKYFLVPFRDRLDAVISLNDRELNSDKLYINNGPDALYKINYNLTYKVVDAVKFYNVKDNFESVIVTRINDRLREYADEGHALEIVKDYREHLNELVALINKETEELGVECTMLKINFIEPLGKN